MVETGRVLRCILGKTNTVVKRHVKAVLVKYQKRAVEKLSWKIHGITYRMLIKILTVKDKFDEVSEMRNMLEHARERAFFVKSGKKLG